MSHTLECITITNVDNPKHKFMIIHLLQIIRYAKDILSCRQVAGDESVDDFDIIQQASYT